MPPIDNTADRLMRVLGAQADRRLRQLGYSNLMSAEAKREAEWWLRARAQALSRRSGLLGGWSVVWPNAGVAELVPLDLPAAGRGEVSVEIHSSVVSPGTERAQYLRLPNAAVAYPHRPGYSAAGYVTRVGEGVTRLSPGDPVALSGAQHASIATLSEEFAYRVPVGLDLADAAFVHFGVICAQGVRRAGPIEGERVCVIGAGLIGALALRLALAGGAAEASVVARSRSKEAVALAGGASRLLVAGEDDDEIARLECPVVIEATGDPRVLPVATAAAAPGGRVVLLGSSRGVTPDLDPDALRSRRLTLIGAHVNTLAAENGPGARRAEAERFLGLLAEGRLAVGDLRERSVDPREAGAFYRELATSHDIVGAGFDWTLLPQEERSRKAGFMHLPDVSGRGVESERAPLPNRDGGLRRAGPAADPLAGAEGRIRFGLLGCGDIAVANAAAIAAAPNAEITACFDPSAGLAQDLAGTYGADVAPTAEALLERDDVDAVFIAVPHHLHAPLAVDAALRGRHVVVEKPLANTLAGAQEMVAAARDAGVELSICFPHRYQAEVLEARRLIDEGALGRFSGAHLSFIDDKPPSYWLGGPSGRSHSDWRASRQKAGGGSLIMNLPHYFDLLRHLSGSDPVEVMAATSSSRPGSEVEDTVSISLTYEDGALASLFCCTAMRGARSVELRLWGSDGQIQLEPDGRAYTLRAVEGLRSSRWQPIGGELGAGIRTVYVSRFATALAQGRPPEVSGADGLAVQAVMEACYRSSESGRSVRPADLLAEVNA